MMVNHIMCEFTSWLQALTIHTMDMHTCACAHTHTHTHTLNNKNVAGGDSQGKWLNHLLENVYMQTPFSNPCATPDMFTTESKGTQRSILESQIMYRNRHFFLKLHKPNDMQFVLEAD